MRYSVRPPMAGELDATVIVEAKSGSADSGTREAAGQTLARQIQ